MTQVRRSETFKAKQARQNSKPGEFNYQIDFKTTNFRRQPDLYRVGVGEQGVLLVEPYKSEILPYWKFRTPDVAQKSAEDIYSLFLKYKKQKDFVGMDMSRKFLQMGYTRSRRYANHSSGRKYDQKGKLLPFKNDASKAQSAEIFRTFWQKVEKDALYQKLKMQWKSRYKPAK